MRRGEAGNTANGNQGRAISGTFFLKGENCEAKAPQHFIEPIKKYQRITRGKEYTKTYLYTVCQKPENFY
jgi:hypothetical protein